MKANLVISLFIGILSVDAIKLGFTPSLKEDAPDNNGTILSETMKSLKESEKLTG